MKRVVFVSLAAFLAVSLSAQTTDTKKDSEVELNQYGQQVNSTPGQVKIQDGIMVLDAKKIDYKMWFDIRVQGDAAVFFGGPDFTSSRLDGKDNPNHIGNGMSIRRARFAVKAQLDRNWYGEIDTDWADGICELKDAILAYNGVPGLEIKAGNFKESFSIQRNTTSRYLMFMERPMVTSLAPSRHLGLNLTYSNKWFWFAGGVFGPELKGAEEATAMKDNNKDLGRNAGLSYTGKVVFRPLYKCSESALHLGGAISYREPKVTSTDAYGAARYSSRNSTSINRKKYLDTDVIQVLTMSLPGPQSLPVSTKGFAMRAPTSPAGLFWTRRSTTSEPSGPTVGTRRLPIFFSAVVRTTTTMAPNRPESLLGAPGVMSNLPCVMNIATSTPLITSEEARRRSVSGSTSTRPRT